MKRRTAARLIVALVLSLASLAALASPSDSTSSAVVPIALPDETGRQIDVPIGKGEPVVVNFWAFWCDTWKAEMPHLRSLATRQKELGFHLVCISVDGTRLAEFKKSRGGPVPFPVLLDVGGRVSKRFGIAHVPTVVILDGAGTVAAVYVGYPGNEVVLRKLRDLCSSKTAVGSTD